ncbi:hypothetical protein L9F63_002785, partial [Diploptera punctata]
TQEKIATISGLKNNSLYQFRVRAVVSDGQVGEANLSEWISTLNSTFQPQPVSNITLVSTKCMSIPELLEVTISWIPAQDRTCHYEALCWVSKILPRIRYISK